eukprot:COSAG01_NODE_5531_length_4203_cov_8.341618_3_plen_59_part_00
MNRLVGESQSLIRFLSRHIIRLTEIARPGALIVLGFEQRAHKRPELASPTCASTTRGG